MAVITAFGRLVWLRRNPIRTAGSLAGPIMGLENGWRGWHVGPVELLIGPREEEIGGD